MPLVLQNQNSSKMQLSRSVSTKVLSGLRFLESATADAAAAISGLGFEVSGLGFEVSRLGFEVSLDWGLACSTHQPLVAGESTGLGVGVKAAQNYRGNASNRLHFRAILRFWGWSSNFGVWGSRFWAWGSGFAA